VMGGAATVMMMPLLSRRMLCAENRENPTQRENPLKQ
jgi:hypothetical protein